MRLLISTLFCLSIALVNSTTTTVEQFVIKGHEAVPEQHRFVAHVRTHLDRKSHCGGTLIAPKYILTAAHCHQPAHLIKFVVIGNHFNLDNMDEPDSIIRDVVNVTLHPAYNEQGIVENDFAIVELDKPVTEIEPVYLSASTHENYGEFATAFGWGVHNSDDLRKGSDVLKQDQYELITPKSCDSKMRESIQQKTKLKSPIKFFIDESVICTNSANGNSVCFGDSGGPLVRDVDQKRPVQIGIASWVIQCGLTNSPTGFARVSSARGFIDQVAVGHEWSLEDASSTSGTISMTKHFLFILTCLLLQLY